jgi:serine/threonine-protein kinase
VDLATNATIGQNPIPMGPPQYAAFTPDGRNAYIRVYDEIRASGNALAVINTAIDKVTATLITGQHPTNILIAPDSKHACITNISSDNVDVLNTGRATSVEGLSLRANPLWAWGPKHRSWGP